MKFNDLRVSHKLWSVILGLLLLMFAVALWTQVRTRQTTDEAERLVPKKLSATEAKKRFALSRSGAEGSWRLRYLGPGKAEDVFAEADSPFFIESARVGEGFELKLFSGDAPAKAADATLTIVTDAGAFEAPARLE